MDSQGFIMGATPNVTVKVADDRKIQETIDEVRDYVSKTTNHRHASAAIIRDPVAATMIEATLTILGGLLADYRNLRTRVEKIEKGTP